MEKARRRGLLEFKFVHLRDFSDNKHGQVDDRVFGGGPGMLFQVGPLDRALASLPGGGGRRILTDPRGTPLSGAWGRRLAETEEEITLICPNYEGVDYRVNEHLIDEAVSVGDYIISSGETASLIIMEVIARFIPGFMGKAGSAEEESHDDSRLLEYPQYTRPEIYKSWPVPKILLSGNHGKIKTWRIHKRWELTRLCRPDLYQKIIEERGPAADPNYDVATGRYRSTEP